MANQTTPHQLNLRLLSPDATDSDDRPIYVAGTFNGWQAGQSEYRMQVLEDGHFGLEVPLPAAHTRAEYKYTRGGWEAVELNGFGEFTPNRTWRADLDRDCTDRVARWASRGLYYREELLPNIVAVEHDFPIPERIRTRRVTALLPHDYYETDRRYPVLYLQDGQNLFDDYAPYGSWGVDKRLAVLAERGRGDIIIVAIDHANEDRMAEFTPGFNNVLGRGEGREYVRFLARNLKPLVDEQFRTLPGAEHTGIGGSSLGGLISIYAGLLYPDVFQKLMIFSPSLWVTPKIPFQLLRLDRASGERIYLYGGAAESASMIPNLKRFQEQLLHQNGADRVEFRLAIDPEGRHNEARWGLEFPRAIEWLFFPETGA
ncbi:MAG: alpha/beta hydrolase-fold protein [Saprospiraceae bacterium]